MLAGLVIALLLVLLSGGDAFHLSSLRQPGARQGRRQQELSMNMMDRFFRVVKSNVNSVLSSLEDPEKVLDQAVNDMQTDLVKIRQNYAEISATQKRMEKQKTEADTLAADWYKRAQLALAKGDEDLAREALSRRQIQTDIAGGISNQMTLQATAIEKLYASMQQLELKITDAKRQKDSMVARARTAKTSVQVTDMLNSIGSGSSNSMDAFERMKAKVETLEAKAEVAGELAASSAGSSMEERFRVLEGGSAIDDELAALKRQLPGGQRDAEAASSEPIAALPMQSIPMPDNKTELDLEYERLKRELGK